MFHLFFKFLPWMYLTGGLFAEQRPISDVGSTHPLCGVQTMCQTGARLPGAERRSWSQSVVSALTRSLSWTWKHNKTTRHSTARRVWGNECLHRAPRLPETLQVAKTITDILSWDRRTAKRRCEHPPSSHFFNEQSVVLRGANVIRILCQLVTLSQMGAR